MKSRNLIGIFLVLVIGGGAAFFLSRTPFQAETPVAPTEPQTAPTTALSEEPKMSTAQADMTVDATGLSKTTVTLETTQGVIKFKFYPKDAPATSARIAELVGKGFYNGLKFHRVVPGFVVQGGDPSGTGAGGSGQKLSAEFNARKHIEGTVAMARSQDPNSADSQFYISLGRHPHLDGSYTVFGMVTEGMDVARKIQPGDKMTSVSID